MAGSRRDTNLEVKAPDSAVGFEVVGQKKMTRHGTVPLQAGVCSGTLGCDRKCWFIPFDLVQTLSSLKFYCLADPYNYLLSFEEALTSRPICRN